MADPAGYENLLVDFDWIVNMVSAGPGGSAAYETTYRQGTRQLLNWLRRAPPRRLRYPTFREGYAAELESMGIFPQIRKSGRKLPSGDADSAWE
ncbi:MAG TPA: hypothetical protein P5555_14375 [Candidatus Paceibacterota bacterium]|nr:hypothetical protein [Verrucomicrobiota bacterium]HRZ46372.1 hypothetical protein [Candidatus Paceibacterota bacterium]HSA00272.1 hypothetical protein [Candidatus Paceibacterota bacterium]